MRCPLPDPCPICSGPLTYGGRGRRPVFCSPRCKAASDAQSRPDRRAAETPEESAASEAKLHAILDRRPAHDLTRRTRDRLVATRGMTTESPKAYLADDGRLSRAFAPDRTRDRPTRRAATTVDDQALDGFTLDGAVKGASRKREKDPAALWLADHHPEALADFGHDF
ncbi:MAG: hypothetical protein GC157_01125 [Frankiales bacterium]|nr:hypothetical protein [Frankiales bacterium]